MIFSLRTKLLSAFALDLVLLLALGFFASWKMSSMSGKAALVEHQIIPSQLNVGRIENALGRYRTHQLEYLVHANVADKDRIEDQMRDVEQEVTEYFEIQERFLANAEEQQAFERVRVAWDGFVEANHLRFLPATRESNTGTVQPAWSRLHPLHEELMAAARELAELNQAQATQALGATRFTYREARLFLVADTMLSLLISAAVGLVLATSIARRLGRLTAATIAVSGGDLDRRVEPEGGDEIEMLARNFNVMVNRLRGKREALENQNAELEASLERQHRLTEDLVRRTESEEEALRAQAEAEAASKAKSYFLATISHELRTPLNAILGYAQILQLEAQARGDGRDLHELDRIQAAGKHLLGLIGNALDFSKIEQGKMDFAVTTVEIPALAREVVSIIDPLARQHGNRLELHCPEDLAPGRWDPGKLRQILFNLLSNAVKFTHNGAVELTITECSSNGPGASERLIEFAVKDTGIGIAEADLAHLFQPFDQLRNPTTRRFDGTGLGLVVSRQLCRMMGGEIHVTSTPGEGSTFTVELPAEARIEQSARKGPLPTKINLEQLAS